MALTKIGKEGITGVSNASNATFLTATSAEGVTLAGTLAVTGVHTVGTNAVATSDGGAATTNIVQGLAKGWLNFNGQSTVAIRDSFNISGLTDEGTGDYSPAINSDMANANYAITMAVASYAGDADTRFPAMLKATSSNNWGTIATNGYRIIQRQVANGGSTIDGSLHINTIHGDLA